MALLHVVLSLSRSAFEETAIAGKLPEQIGGMSGLTQLPAGLIPMAVNSIILARLASTRLVR